MIHRSICGRCHSEQQRLYTANCAEQPEYAPAAAQRYACPDCGAVLHAGMRHPRLCRACMDRSHRVLDEVH